MKLYITGPVAGGKTTLARQLSQATGIPCFHLDQVAHQPYPEDPGGNRRRPEAERDALFRGILEREDYILEDTGRACFVRGMEEADGIVLLEPSPFRRRKRIVVRWLKQNLGWEACGYRPTAAMLRSMFRWSRNYETGKDGVKARVAQFPEKLLVLRSKRDVRRFLREIEGPGR